MHLLYNYEVKAEKREVLKYFKTHKYDFLPKGYSTDSAIDIFGDYVVIISHTDIKALHQNTLFTVIVNPQIANDFRVWLKWMWKLAVS